jgi:hypothetical protein
MEKIEIVYVDSRWSSDFVCFSDSESVYRCISWGGMEIALFDDFVARFHRNYSRYLLSSGYELTSFRQLPQIEEGDIGSTARWVSCTTISRALLQPMGVNCLFIGNTFYRHLLSEKCSS